MQDIKWERKEVMLGIKAGSSIAILECNVSVPNDGTCDTAVLFFVEDALEAFLFHSCESDIAFAYKNKCCLSACCTSGNLIEEGFVRTQDSTGTDVMFDSLSVVDISVDRTGFNGCTLLSSSVS